MSGMRVDILERELNKLKKKEPERFKKIINKLLEIEEEKQLSEGVFKIEPTYSVFQHPEIERTGIADLPDNPVFIEQAYYSTISKLSTQNEKFFFNSQVKLNEESILHVPKDIYENLKEMFYIEGLDDDIFDIGFRLQRDQGTILSPVAFIKAKKMVSDLIKNKESKFRYLFEAIDGSLTKAEFNKESKKLFINLIKKNIKKFNELEFITIIALNIRNTSNRYYENIERRDNKIIPEDLFFIFPLFEGYKYLRSNVELFSPLKGKYKMDVFFQWSSNHQVTFTIWMVSFLIAIKLYNLAKGGKLK